MRGIRLFPIGLIVLSGAVASAQTSAQTSAVQNAKVNAQ